MIFLRLSLKLLELRSFGQTVDKIEQRGTILHLTAREDCILLLFKGEIPGIGYVVDKEEVARTSPKFYADCFRIPGFRDGLHQPPL